MPTYIILKHGIILTEIGRGWSILSYWIYCPRCTITIEHWPFTRFIDLKDISDMRWMWLWDIRGRVLVIESKRLRSMTIMIRVEEGQMVKVSLKVMKCYIVVGI